MITISAQDPFVIPKAVKALENGELIIFPTETAYGVGVNALNSNAVSALLNYKKRPEGKAISIATYSIEEAKKYVKINSIANNLYNQFLPGPVTIISKSLGVVDKRLESENKTLGVRIPNHKLVLDLLKEFNKPITATSANYSGAKTPYSVKDILDYLPKKSIDLIGLIIDAGELPKNPPSTVIDTTSTELTTLRQGRIDPFNSKLVYKQVCQSEQDLIDFAYNFTLKNCFISKTNLILLNGEMGAGKTHFTKGIAKALKISQVIKSPTYNYVNEYSFNNYTFYHLDAWRLQNKEDLNLLGFYKWFTNGNVIAVEWPSVIMNLDSDYFDKLNYFYIDFIILDDSKREIRIYKTEVKP